MPVPPPPKLAMERRFKGLDDTTRWIFSWIFVFLEFVSFETKLFYIILSHHLIYVFCIHTWITIKFIMLLCNMNIKASPCVLIWRAKKCRLVWKQCTCVGFWSCIALCFAESTSGRRRLHFGSRRRWKLCTVPRLKETAPLVRWHEAFKRKRTRPLIILLWCINALSLQSLQLLLVSMLYRMTILYT